MKKAYTHMTNAFIVHANGIFGLPFYKVSLFKCCMYSYFPFFFLQTALCSTAIDNPNNVTKFDVVQHIMSYLDTDTVLFQSSVRNGHKQLLQFRNYIIVCVRTNKISCNLKIHPWTGEERLLTYKRFKFHIASISYFVHHLIF